VSQEPNDRLWYGSHQAFGRDGAGGSMGIADPWYGPAYAWIPRRMSYLGGADERGLELALVPRSCISTLGGCSNQPTSAASWENDMSWARSSPSAG
jgi:hypothetical protein